MENNYVLSADVGGSHITVAVCDTANHTVLDSTIRRTELDSKGSKEHILDVWCQTLVEVIASCETEVNCLSLAMPGPFDYENGFCYIRGFDKYDALFGMNIKYYLADTLNLSPDNIKFRNDAEAIIAGEAISGAGKGMKKIVGITLGTGFGSALHQNGQTTDLNLGSATYKESIADDYFSTRWFLRKYQELTGCRIKNVKELVDTDEKPEIREEIFRQFARGLNEFLTATVTKVAPEALIVCGNIARASALFLPYLTLNTSVIKAALGEKAALIGAAALFSPEYTSSIVNSY